MRPVAVVSTAQRQEPELSGLTEVELMAPLIEKARSAVGLTQADIGFTCSGSSDFLAGQAFSFVMTLDAVGPVPPIAESHVEMDGAWALYEAWVKLQIGEIDTALVYSYGKSSPGSIRDVLATQLDPYYVAPLWPDSWALGALQARVLLEGGVVSERRMAEIAARSQSHAAGNANAVRAGTPTVDDLLDTAFVADPLRPHDCAATADGGVAVVLAADDRAGDLSDRPAWIRGIDHRIDAHHFGVRDLVAAPSAALAARHAGLGSDRVDIAELHSPFTTSEHLLTDALGLDEAAVTINPSGGALAGDTLMASGLMRIAEVADRISAGTADRGVAHASSGPWLQQNLVCVMGAD
ncbi:MAG: lipid-transfer protein [Acidimicrobiia bacterium]|nr:lipid-transfer protein [Acidimicrobiia bacterium]